LWDGGFTNEYSTTAAASTLAPSLSWPLQAFDLLFSNAADVGIAENGQNGPFPFVSI
jgi:hypothetical protein